LRQKRARWGPRFTQDDNSEYFDLIRVPLNTIATTTLAIIYASSYNCRVPIYSQVVGFLAQKLLYSKSNLWRIFGMRHFLCAVVLVVCNLAIFAQDAPKAEVFAGFSYANYELIPTAASVSTISSSEETISGGSSARLGLFGWNGAVAVNMNRWFSFATDISGYYSSSSTSTTTKYTLTNNCFPVNSCTPTTNTVTYVYVASRPKIHNFLFGPQFSYPAGRIRPFAHLLMGGEHTDVARYESVTNSNSIGTSSISSLVPTQNITGFAMAMGGGLDYSIMQNLAWRIGSDYLTGQGTGQNHVRVSTGLVWRLGN
jgi:hypothetical protein